MQRINITYRSFFCSMAAALSLSLSATTSAEGSEGSEYIDSLWGAIEAIENKSYLSGGHAQPAWSRLALPNSRLVWGNGATESGTNSIAIGSDASVLGNQSIAMGALTKASGGGTVAIGPEASSNGTNSIAIGSKAQTEADWQSYRNVGNIAIGREAKVSGGDEAVAFGYQAHAHGAYAVALGSGAQASSNSVAIGRGAVAPEANVVSVGRGDASDPSNSPRTRRITNVTQGMNETDAANISQVRAVERRVTDLRGEITPIQAQVTTLQQKVTPLWEEFPLVKADVTTLRSHIATLQTTVTPLRESVTTLSTGFRWTPSRTTPAGFQAVAVGTASVAAGANAYSSGYSTAFGSGATALQGRSVAIGSNTQVGSRLNESLGDYGIGIGYSAQSLAGYSIAIGAQSKALELSALAVGNLADAQAENAVAIGALAKASGGGSVALGHGSLAEGVNEVSVGASSVSGNLRRHISNVADGTLAHHVATVGQLEGETTKVAEGLHTKLDSLLRREDGAIQFDGQHVPIRLTNIAEGLSANDAVNYTQLLRLSDTLAAQGLALTELTSAAGYIQSLGDEERPFDGGSEAAQPTGKYSMAFGAYAHSAGESSVALGSGSTTTEEAMYGMAIGYGSSVSGERSTALGYFANGVGEESLALGNEAQSSGARSMAVGHGARAEADGSFALGHESVAREAHTISVGDVDLERRITNVQDGRDPTDAVNIRQLHAALGEARVSAFTSFVGGLRVDSNTGVRVLDLDMHGAPVRVSGVASGQAEHDAVNVGQLKVIQDRLDAFANRSEAQSAGVYGRSAAPDTDASSSQSTRNRTRAGTADDALPSQVEEAVAVAKSYADEAVAQTASSSKAYTDEKVTNLVSNADFETFRSDVNTRIAGLTRRVSKVGAMGAAMAGMAGAIAAAPGTESRVSGAVGNYRGEGAFALGFSQRIPGNGAILVGGSLAGGESSGTIGVSFGW